MVSRSHKVVHGVWERGIGIRADARELLGGDVLRDRIVSVQTTDRASLRRLAYELARAFRIECGYDVSMFPRYLTPNDSIRAWVLIREGRAVGVAFSDLLRSWSEGERLVEGNGVSVEGVFVCGAFRRFGYGQYLVRNIANAYAIDVSELAFRTPFTKDGRTLITSLVPIDLIRRSGDIR